MLIWSLWLFQAAVCALQVRRFGRRLGSTTDRYENREHRPMASVIVPFKGVDADMESGLAGLFEQDYPTYRLLLVVESADDPACEVLNRVMARYPDCEAELIVAGVAGPEQGQKVHNQLAALDSLEPRCSDGDVWVFADSDAAPNREWLASMVLPLISISKYGMTTGYRWLIPTVEGDDIPADAQPTVWSHLGSVINSSAACFMGYPRFDPAWGGSMGIRVDVAREGGLRDYLKGALTDDYQFTRLCRNMGKKVRFVKQCLVPTPVDFSRASLWNFGHRQYLITRIYWLRLWVFAFACASVYLAGLISALAWLAWLAVDGRLDTTEAAVPLAVLIAVALLNQLRAWFRVRVVRRAFGDEVVKQLRTTLRWDRFGTTAAMLLHWLVIMRSLLGRTMNWRGNIYRLSGRQKIRKLN